MRTEATYIALKRPKPCLQRRFGQRNRKCTPILVQEPTFLAVCLRVSVARTIHYGLPLYLRVRKSHTHEHMAMESELTPTVRNVGGILT